MRRVDTIWRTWLQTVACPVFVSTVKLLTINNRFDPFSGLRYDEQGRERYLNPYAGRELEWRSEISFAPQYNQLSQAIAAAKANPPMLIESNDSDREWFTWETSASREDDY